MNPELPANDLGLPAQSKARLAIALNVDLQLAGFALEENSPALRRAKELLRKKANYDMTFRLEYHWLNSDQGDAALEEFVESLPVRSIMEQLVTAESLVWLEDLAPRLQT